MLLQNADIVKERERDVMSVSKSIVELNSLFKDLASMIVDQSTLKVKSALKSVEKAEKYQKNDKKMHCIVCLSITIIVLLILLIIVKS
uniref:t-SNARE coiled-coil homology domain-containing protein n=1 Tax=Parascaris equorum TaxID=6256 RepID=A0A914RUE5_PAREQ